MQILANVGPPYSEHFVRQLLTLMARSNVRKRREASQRAHIQTNLLTQFATDVQSIQFDPPLEARERTLLKEMSTELYY